MIEERINMFIEMYQCQLNGANERLKEDVRALIKAEQDGSTYYLDKKNYLSNLTKEINDTEQRAYIIKEFLDSLKLIKKEVTSKWIPFTFDEEGILNCELPDIDEDILVLDMDGTFDKEHVWVDTWEVPDAYVYGLGSGMDLDGLAWMPLPKAYKEKENA
ncbi:hypothetical protein [uncultured Holdemanella sp.]|mgnify:FL=1|uniref:hypothetical protein n=1 Tax=uncultured Holdemanella sp. TaxID=1763549 RepID=UPI0025DC432F|nr:hypothetical protein [uncultured Holdemanella sp.]